MVNVPTDGFIEEAHVFGPADSPLLGILSLPEGPTPDTAVIVVVGGPQYRVGSHRQFVLLGRALARQGHAAFRFDYTGMGDSPGELATFLSANRDIGEAVRFIGRRLPGVRRIALWGLCDGASAALLYWHETRDERVQGLCLLNPWVRSAESHAATQVKHYYLQRLRQPAFWRKLLTGRVAAGAVSELLRSVRTMLKPAAAASPSGQRPAARGPDAPFQARMAEAWHGYPGRLLLLLSGDDYTAKEFQEALNSDPRWKDALKHPRLEDHELPAADHTFSEPSASRRVEQLTSAWLAGAGQPR